MSFITLSEYNQRKYIKDQEEKQRLKNEKDELFRFIESSNIRPHESSSLFQVKNIRDQIKNGNVCLYQIKCDHCSTQMIKIIETIPILESLYCPGCGYIGYLS